MLVSWGPKLAVLLLPGLPEGVTLLYPPLFSSNGPILPTL